jgi:hypothetical protein
MCDNPASTCLISLNARIVVFVVSCMLYACTTSRQMTLPDGTQGQMIGCSGVQHDMGSCYLKAGEICPDGYDIVNQSQGGGPNSAAASLIGAQGGIDRELIVRCH